MKFEHFNSYEHQKEVSRNIKKQLENLGLTLSEIKGSVLDIGAGEALFEKELEKITGAEITSIDNFQNEDMSDNVVIADARELPFEDNTFDKVVSHASVPHIFIGMYSEDYSELSKAEMKKSISRTFRETLRVLKPGSRAIMAPVRIGDTYNSEKVLASVLGEVMKDIQEKADVSFELIREVEDPQNHERHKQYRLTLVKK